MFVSETTIPDIGIVTIKKNFYSKSIRISINSKRGVLISIPLFCSEQRAVDFCNSKKNWILKKLTEINSKIEKNIFTQDSIFISRNYKTVFSLKDCNRIHVKIENNIIHFFYNSVTDFEDKNTQSFIKKVISNVLKHECENYIIPRCKEIAEKHNIKYSSIKIGTAKTRWGSCSGKNDIIFSSSLMMLPDDLIDFIIYHEFCHIYHKNHGERFHSLLNNYLNGREKEYSYKIKKYTTEIIPGDFSHQN